jgi:hypothetical protein
MPSEPKRDGRGCALTAAIGLIVLPLLYVLSMGPAWRAHKAGAITLDAYFAAYYPLHWLCDMSPDFSGAIDWYIKLWVP